LDYALYLKGLVNFNDTLGLFSSIAQQDLAERDPKQAKESFEAFRELVSRFPESKYTPDAKLRMSYIRNSLARSDLYVAQYYFKRGAYVAAINRAQNAINEYREVPSVEEALFILYESYDRLGLTQLRDDTKRILEKSFPNSPLINPTPEAKSAWWKLWR
jgi:outer membrane protein assembly factor BamD